MTEKRFLNRKIHTNLISINLGMKLGTPNYMLDLVKREMLYFQEQNIKGIVML